MPWGPQGGACENAALTIKKVLCTIIRNQNSISKNLMDTQAHVYTYVHTHVPTSLSHPTSQHTHNLGNPDLRPLRKIFLNTLMKMIPKTRSRVYMAVEAVLIDRWELSCLSVIQHLMNICFDYCHLQKPGHIPSVNCLVLFCPTP